MLSHHCASLSVLQDGLLSWQFTHGSVTATQSHVAVFNIFSRQASTQAASTAQHPGSINLQPELAACGSACWCAIMQAQLFATDQAGKGARTVLVSTSNAGERQPYVLCRAASFQAHLVCNRSLAGLHLSWLLLLCIKISQMHVTCWHTCVPPSNGIAGSYAKDDVANVCAVVSITR